MSDKTYRHVVWDMGGTIVDTYPQLDQTLASVVRAEGFDITEHEVALLTRQSTGTAIGTLAERFSLPESQFRNAEAELKRRWRTDPPPTMPGLREAMAAVVGGNFVVTHRERRSAESLLEQLEIDVDDMVCQKDGFERKPDPSMHLHLLEKYNLEPSECLCVGDRPIDAHAARKAGMASAMLADPRIPAEHDADFAVSGLTQIIPLLHPQS